MNKNKIFQELEEFIAIESVSADASRSGQIIKAVEFLVKKLKFLKFEVKVIKIDEAPPLIVAERKADRSRPVPTVAVYAHYDVQPENPVEGWKTPPFELTLKDGKMWGRGIADDKGHIIQNIAAVESLISKGRRSASPTINKNIIFIFEGEEETGSEHFEELILEEKKLLEKVDAFYITDSGMHEKNVPQIEYALRGLIYFELEVTIGDRDLHSGIYGNRVLNPVQVISELIAKIKDSSAGRINIPQFNDKVRKLTEKEQELLKLIARSDEEEKKEANTYGVIAIDKNLPYLSSKIYPSFDCHGIISGYTGQGSKTVIPKSAEVKFSFRLVENQNPDEVEQMVQKFVSGNLPSIVKYELRTLAKSGPFYTSIDNKYVEDTAQVFEEIFGNKTLFNRSGGSIAAAEILQRLFQKPVILTGFTLPDDNIHSPNENFDEEMFWKGIEALKGIYST